jgi:hypothetical protein
VISFRCSGIAGRVGIVELCLITASAWIPGECPIQKGGLQEAMNLFSVFLTMLRAVFMLEAKALSSGGGGNAGDPSELPVSTFGGSTVDPWGSS